ncbi:MAG: iron ABC transporter permease [Vicingaceae bacterium]
MKLRSLSYLSGLLLLLLLFFLDLIVGSANLSLSEVWQVLWGQAAEKSHEIIVLQSRLPKAITAVLCGAALSVSGLLMQTLFRNPLAGPYILGISSGAGLGVALLVLGAGILGFSMASPFGIIMGAILGAVGVLLILFLVSLRIQDVMSLLILGIMIGSIATALIGLMQYFSHDFQLKAFLIWTLGSLEGLSFQQLGIVGLTVLLLLLWAMVQSKPMNALLLGEEYAKSLGVSIHPLRLSMIVISGGLAGVITAFCGPIGFVGIIVPHLARLWFKTTNHLVLLPASILMGASILLLSDILSHLPAEGISLPINSITSLIGIPIIIWIIFRKRSISAGF